MEKCAQHFSINKQEYNKALSLVEGGERAWQEQGEGKWVQDVPCVSS